MIWAHNLYKYFCPKRIMDIFCVSLMCDNFHEWFIHICNNYISSCRLRAQECWSLISSSKSYFEIFSLLLFYMGFYRLIALCWASQVALMVENLPANSRDREDTSLIPGSGRSPGGGHGNPLQYSCLENPMDRRAWQPMVHRVTKYRHDWSSLARKHRI